jgi:hypothetical protein
MLSMARHEQLPEKCHHELLMRVDRLESKDRPLDCEGALKPFMLCHDCGAVLYLLRSGPLGTDIWPRSEG